jgi:lipopolysaccharide/colanic/teichoic acid biosynthesis glycosyltransferase
MLIIAIMIKRDSPGPVFYRQERVTTYGKVFRIHKFRTMVTDADKMGTQVTVGGDARITRMGHRLRSLRLDELPQLLDVLAGNMSFVGTRPEVKKYVDLYTEEQRRVLSVRPGITDYASIEYVDENEILGKADDPDRVYVEEIMPAKIKLNMRYIENRNLNEYFKIIGLTFINILR